MNSNYGVDTTTNSSNKIQHSHHNLQMQQIQTPNSQQHQTRQHMAQYDQYYGSYDQQRQLQLIQQQQHLINQNPQNYHPAPALFSNGFGGMENNSTKQIDPIDTNIDNGSNDTLNSGINGNNSQQVDLTNQETDNEALSSLLMLSKSNAESNKSAENESVDGSNKFSHSIKNDSSYHAMQLQQPLHNQSPSPLKRESDLPLSKTIKLDDLRRYFHLPIVEVAKQLGTCTTALKKLCRKNDIHKWPYRQIKSLSKSIQSLEMASLNDSLSAELKAQYKEQIAALQVAINDIITDPNKEISLDKLGLSNGFVYNEPNDDGNERFDLVEAYTRLQNTSNNNNNKQNNDSSKQAISAKYPTPHVEEILKAALAMSNEPTVTKTNSTKNKRKFQQSSLDESDEGFEQSNNNLSKIIEIVDDNLNNNNSTNNDMRSKIVDIGLTIARCEINPDNKKIQFSGPIQLAALHRKKLRPNVSRKVVPLMEPDIGSNFAIEFIPQFVLNIANNKQIRASIGLPNSGLIDENRHQSMSNDMTQQVNIPQSQRYHDQTNHLSGTISMQNSLLNHHTVGEEITNLSHDHFNDNMHDNLHDNHHVVDSLDYQQLLDLQQVTG
eukprot:gene3958-5677_t